MDILSGLKDKLRFIERYYVTVSKLFLERQTKIQETDGAVEEWMEADESLNLLRQSALQLVHRALRDYLNCFVAVTRLRPPSSKNWWGSYKEYFLRTFGIDWEDGPVSPSELEEINLVRNDSEHGSEAIGMDRRQSEDHQQRFPNGLFVDEFDVLPQIIEGWPRRIYVSAESLIECIRRVEVFCEFLEENRRLALRRAAALIRSQAPIK